MHSSTTDIDYNHLPEETLFDKICSIPGFRHIPKKSVSFIEAQRKREECESKDLYFSLRKAESKDQIIRSEDMKRWDVVENKLKFRPKQPKLECEFNYSRRTREMDEEIYALLSPESKIKQNKRPLQTSSKYKLNTNPRNNLKQWYSEPELIETTLSLKLNQSKRVQSERTLNLQNPKKHLQIESNNDSTKEHLYLPNYFQDSRNLSFSEESVSSEKYSETINALEHNNISLHLSKILKIKRYQKDTVKYLERLSPEEVLDLAVHLDDHIQTGDFTQFLIYRKLESIVEGMSDD